LTDPYLPPSANDDQDNEPTTNSVPRFRGASKASAVTFVSKVLWRTDAADDHPGVAPRNGAARAALISHNRRNRRVIPPPSYAEPTRMQLGVLKKDGEWTVYQDGAPIASGGTRSACIEMASAIAFEAEERGEVVELLIQDYMGEVKRRITGNA